MKINSSAAHRIRTAARLIAQKTRPHTPKATKKPRMKRTMADQRDTSPNGHRIYSVWNFGLVDDLVLAASRFLERYSTVPLEISGSVDFLCRCVVQPKLPSIFDSYARRFLEAYNSNQEIFVKLLKHLQEHLGKLSIARRVFLEEKVLALNYAGRVVYRPIEIATDGEVSHFIKQEHPEWVTQKTP
jgi:hypothetical protein